MVELLVYVIRWFSGLSINREITNLFLDGLKTHMASARLCPVANINMVRL